MSLLRRRELMGKAKETVKNGLVAGDVSHGTTVAEVDSSGNVVITKMGAYSANSISCPFKFPVYVGAGDTVRVKLTKIVAGQTHFTDGWLTGTPSGELGIWANTYTNFKNATPVDKSVTSAAERELVAFGLNARNGTMTTPTTFSVQIYVNGVEQFG